MARLLRRRSIAAWCVSIVALAVPSFFTPGVGGPAFAQVAVSEQTLDSVFLVGVMHADGSFTEVGTAWTIAPNWLATNAHVAEGLLEVVGTDGRMVARRGVLDQNECALGNIRMHPAYTTWNQRLGRMLVGSASELKEFDMIAVADVAVMEVIAGDAGRPLVTCDMADPSHEPGLGSTITYVGFPAENLSGFATAHVVRGNITAKTDFFFMRTSWADSLLLHFAGPATGGASGSPVLDEQGRVIGILSAAEHLSLDDQTRISFGFTYAQRIDLALELLDGTVDANQRVRDRQWLARALDLFVKPETLIARLIDLHAAFVGVEPSRYTTVTQRQDTMPVESPERSIRVVMEPGYEYGFIAVAHDATDIDLYIRSADGTEFGKDDALDQYPVVWLGPYDTRTDVLMVLKAAETLLQPTPITARVIRVDGATLAAAAASGGGANSGAEGEAGLTRIHTETVTADANGSGTWFWTITADPTLTYVCNATSPAMRDIDLRLLKDGVTLVEDVLLDWYPRVEASGYSGELRLELILPEGTQIGDTFEVTIDTKPYAGGG
jgi:hypothetical protein